MEQLAADKSQVPEWASPAISTLALVVASVAVIATHRLSVHRQRRDEFYKRLQECQAVLDKVAQAAADVWRQKHDPAGSRKAIQTVQSDLDDLTDRLSLLDRQHQKLRLTDALADFRNIATLDIESGNRKADPMRADKVLGAARLLARKLTAASHEIYV
ncbi:hypothetical protein JKL49_18705 [Phenylobacterium sp. 20VBR1]|uniref:Uncharacterized protein n=1 Tax=Phenylobacterium glaciei TaxID=2803784 RepID=A0A941D341_9CAUL|nr:hypothetical protein [Phenylobacterium glaciei]MBR7621430.1 hypothetical protein [Phenylobacterium glaciei]QQZ50065.1 hypothetical protein JKL49_26150 [Phenylobacterium glaciei]